MLNHYNITERPPLVTAAAAAIAALIALVAISPPPLAMFPPQGVPQPGAVSEGGGALPASALTVRKLWSKLYIQ